MAIRVPVKFVLVAATTFSTIVSFAGGLVLYLDSIKALEESVRENALSETLSAQRPLTELLADGMALAQRQVGMLTGWHPFETPDEIVDWTFHDVFSTVNTTGAAGAGVQVMINYSTWASGGEGSE
eukprot:Hpha_TRINITY_DN21247_c0_g1::TRINITY_DN21247_c0_g1_i1::g.171615::m.171615